MLNFDRYKRYVDIEQTHTEERISLTPRRSGKRRIEERKRRVTRTRRSKVCLFCH